MVMVPTLTRGTMLSTKMNFSKTPTHGLLKNTQDQKNGNFVVRPSENASQVIITQPIFTNSINVQITARTIVNGYITRNCIVFSLKVQPEISGKI